MNRNVIVGREPIAWRGSFVLKIVKFSVLLPFWYNYTATHINAKKRTIRHKYGVLFERPFIYCLFVAVTMDFHACNRASPVLHIVQRGAVHLVFGAFWTFSAHYFHFATHFWRWGFLYFLTILVRFSLLSSLF